MSAYRTTDTPPPDDDAYVVLREEPDPTSVGAVRRAVADTLIRWGMADLVADAQLCATELATNAVIHSRSPYDVAIRRAGSGVRVEVVDRCPGQIPTPTPTRGSASDITLLSTTGRGLIIVSRVASRWGYSCTPNAKAVWAEIGTPRSASGAAPIVEGGLQPPPPGSGQTLHFLSLPVRSAVMSGVQVEELIRELQLLGDAAPDPEGAAQIHELLDRTADMRLAGRYEAFEAASQGKQRFDFELTTTIEVLADFALLTGLLAELPERLGIAQRVAVTEAVHRFRVWLGEEAIAQLLGQRGPLPSPLET